MKKLLLYLLFACITCTSGAQTIKTEMYDLIKKLLSDSTGFENVGDWAVGQPKKFPVKWKTDGIEMSEDTSINFYKMGSANIAIKGHIFKDGYLPIKWNIMLKGPRMGYTSFSIISSQGNEMQPKNNIDSIFGNKPFTAKLLESCDTKVLTGYYYYELKLPRKDLAFLKISWISVNGKTALRIDCFDNFSKYAVNLDCQ